MEDTNQVSNNHRRKIIALSIFSVIALIGVISLYVYIQYKKTHITTDDAFIDGKVHMIASKVPGTVKALFVMDNQFVKKGELLFEIDDVDYDVRVQDASSAVSAEKTRVAEMKSKIDVAKKQLAELQSRKKSSVANLELQEANLRQADADIKRADALFEKGAISKERLEKTKTGNDIAIAQVKVAREQLKQAESSIETQLSLVKQTEAALQSQMSSVRQKEVVFKVAELNKTYTKIYAPSDGYVTKKNVESGNQIQISQPLMAIVPLLEDIWVIANYKETQLGRVKTGQKVKIKIDTYPDKVFEGKVESIMAGTGAAFSLFPPENATGNYVKVVQRIPVKIIFDKDSDKEHVLRVGMSVAPTILVEK